MKIRQLYLLIIVLSLSTYVGAQTSSPYSRYGIGLFKQKGSVRTHMMGGAGVAMQNKTDVNNINPSALVAMDSTAVLFDLGFHVNHSNFSGERKNETVFSGNLDYVALMIPLHRRWFIAAGIQPVSSVGYNIDSYEAYNGSDPSVYYGVNYDGKGGVSLASITNSFKLPWGVSVGAEFGIIWGNHDEAITEYYTGMDVSYSVRNDIQYHKGLWLTTGAQYTHTYNNLSFILGATYDVPTTITTENESTITSSISTIDESSSNTEKSDMPEGYGIGLSVTFHQKWILSTDYRTKKWANSGFGVDPQRLCDNNIYSLGGEYVPNFNSNKYLKRVAYRAGVHYETGSFKVANSPVKSGYVSMGVGLPSRMNSTLINVGFEFGTIGGFSSKHITETYGQINIGLNLGEVWFVKPKFF